MDSYNGTIQDALTCLLQHIPEWTEKIIIKTLAADVAYLISQGFQNEAFIEGYFNGDDAHFLVKYPKHERGISANISDNQKIVDDILKDKVTLKNEANLKAKIASPEDAEKLADLFSEIFTIYPVPLSKPEHVLRSMEKGTVFVFIAENDKILSAASAEINTKFSNAELTDCATVTSARGKGHMQQLILKLEELLEEKGISCFYTIARSQSFGINKAFYNLGYTYGGRLINNCYIYSGLEDMNVWYKVRS